MEELQRVIPNSEIRVRKGLDLKKIIPQAKEKGFTALIVVNEDRKVPSILSIFLRVLNNKQITNNLPLLSHGLYRSWKTWKVTEFNCQSLKVMEN